MMNSSNTSTNKPRMYGLSDDVIQQVIGVFRRHPEIQRTVIFGSRAMGNYKPGSDIDLSFMGPNISPKTLDHIAIELDDVMLPYTFDLVAYHHLDNEALKDHIRRVGKLFYKPEP